MTMPNSFKGRGFPGVSDSKEYTCNSGNPASIPGSGSFHGEVNTRVFLPGEFHGKGNLAGYSPWDFKELDTTEQLTLKGRDSMPGGQAKRTGNATP